MPYWRMSRPGSPSGKPAVDLMELQGQVRDFDKSFHIQGPKAPDRHRPNVAATKERILQR